MHDVFLYVVSLWDIAESRAWETEIIPRTHIDGPLVLTSVSQRWSRFVTSSSPLWSYLIINTADEDVLEYLQLFLLLSRNRRLFIVLQGSTVVCDAIVMDLLRVGDRIDTLIYPPSISRPTLEKFGVCSEIAHDQLGLISPWCRLSVMQPRQDMNDYSFPTRIQGLWIDGLFPLSKLGMLLHFQSLSCLSLTICPDWGLSPTQKSSLELPNLERLSVQRAFVSGQQVKMPIPIKEPKLRYLHYRYIVDLDLEGEPPENPRGWIRFKEFPMLQEVQIHMAIHLVTTVDSVHPVEKRLQPERQRVQWQRTPAQMLEPAEEARLETLKEQLERAEEQRAELLLLRFVVFLQTSWHAWLRIRKEYLQQSSLEVMISMPEEANGFIWNTAEKFSGSLRLMELTSSKILDVFPEHIQTLRLHGCDIPDSLATIHLPRLISLEINAEGFGYLLVMKCIQVPQLRDLRVLVQDGPGELHEYDWRGTTSNPLDHICLRIEIPCHKRDGCVLVFRLPQTRSLNISSPYLPFRLFLAEPTPLIYTLCADIDNPAAVWHENLMTEWINPHYGVATVSILTSLRRIVLDQSLYLLSKPSPTDELFKLLAKDIHICPQLTSVTVAQCPSSWPRFLCQLRARNRTAMLSRSAKCIGELSFNQPLHAAITSWLLDAIQAKTLNVVERPPIRPGNAWPVRPFEEGEGVFRSCYVCHITGMELGCLESETRSEDCGRDRGAGPKIEAF